MESSRKLYIIEFVGLPGSGKSTIARAFFQDSLNGNVSSYYYGDIPKENERKCLFIPSYFIMFVELALFSLIAFHKVYIKQIYGMIVILYNYFKLKSKIEGILVVDQGLIQKVLSLAHLTKIKKKTAIRLLYHVFRKYETTSICINVDCSIEETIKRLQNRGNEGSRLNKIDGQDLIHAMNVQSYNLYIMRKAMSEAFPMTKQVCINSMNSVQENISIIKKNIYD